MIKRILLVEDDDAIAEALRLHLEEAGYALSRESNGLEAIAVIDKSKQKWDLVLLDIMLPGADGWEVCRHLRHSHASVPVIILSARSAETHRVLGLELGADDYLAKPFSMLELVARVRSLFRRIDQLKTPNKNVVEFNFGHLRIDISRRLVFVNEQSHALTLREFDLLHFLARNPGKVFSRDALLRQVWGSTFDGYEHTVNSHINRLRTKIEHNPRDPKCIVTVWGIGYRFDEAIQ